MPLKPDTLGVLAALSEQTRVSIFSSLAQAPSSITKLSSNLPITRQGTTKHLAVLEAAGLVRRRRVGRETVYEALTELLKPTVADLTEAASTWTQQLNLLKQAAEDFPTRTTLP